MAAANRSKSPSARTKKTTTKKKVTQKAAKTAEKAVVPKSAKRTAGKAPGKAATKVAKKAAGKATKKASPKTAGNRAESVGVSIEPRHEMIARLAYYRAEQRNFEDGDPLADWLSSEKEVDALLAKGAH